MLEADVAVQGERALMPVQDVLALGDLPEPGGHELTYDMKKPSSLSQDDKDWTYLLPVAWPSTLSSPSFRWAKRVSMGAVEKEYGALYIMSIFSFRM